MSSTSRRPRHFCASGCSGSPGGRSNRRSPPTTATGCEPYRACACGGLARFAGRRQRTIVTVLGEIEIERAYYDCEIHGRGFCPRDRALGIEGSHLSPGVLRMVGAGAAAVSFEEGARLLRHLAGISVPARQVERYAERLGEEAARFEREVAEAPAGHLPETMYLG